MKTMTQRKMELLGYYNNEMACLKNAIDRINEVDELMKDVKFVNYLSYSSYENIKKAKSSFVASIDYKIESLFFIDSLNVDCQKDGFNMDQLTEYTLVDYLSKHHSSIEKEIDREVNSAIEGRTVNKTETIFKYNKYTYLELTSCKTLNYKSKDNLLKILFHGHGIEKDHSYISNLEFTDGWNDFDGFSVKIYKNRNFDIKIK